MMARIWRRMTAGRYTRALEAEVARLRGENRALLNSILGIAGVPPSPVAAGEVESCGLAGGLDAVVAGGSKNGLKTASAQGGDARRAGRQAGGPGASPMRRRSWQQINRMLEFESGRKKDAGAEAGVDLGAARKS